MPSKEVALYFIPNIFVRTWVRVSVSKEHVARNSLSSLQLLVSLHYFFRFLFLLPKYIFTRDAFLVTQLPQPLLCLIIILRSRTSSKAKCLPHNKLRAVSLGLWWHDIELIVYFLEFSHKFLLLLWDRYWFLNLSWATSVCWLKRVEKVIVIKGNI